MIAQLHAEGVLPFGYVLGDEGFGQHPLLLDQIARRGLTYLMETPHSTRVWRERPATAVPPGTGKNGRPFIRLRLAADGPPPQSVTTVAAQLPPEAWVPTLLKEGSKGPLVAPLACLRVVAVRNGLPGPTVWLVLRRTRDPLPIVKTSLCNAPADTPVATLGWLMAQHWAVEVVIREGKDEFGLDHYEVRSWRGWHHHLTMTLLAHHLLVRLRRQWGGKAPALTVPQARMLLAATLPLRRLDATTVLCRVRQIQGQNAAAVCSHRRRTFQRLAESS